VDEQPRGAGDASTIFNVLATAGFAALIGGVWLQFGLGPALISSGALLLAAAAVVARGHMGGGGDGTPR
jgi:hypothetical protein